MKWALSILLMIILSKGGEAQTRDEDRFAFRGKVIISLLGGASEIIGGNGGSYPVINPIIGYHINDRFSLLVDATFYTDGPGIAESRKLNLEFNKAGHYGVATRFYTKRNLKCGTGTLQTGLYLFDTDADKPKLNWLFTPGWLYPIGKREKFFVEMAFDFQMNKIIQGDSFLLTAKLGASFHF